MARRGALTHRKTRRLARLLGAPLPYALGVMEALWHSCAERTPRGDIGSLSNQDIADELFWDDDADALVSALVQAGLLDESEEHRLVVHDWSEHADDTVHRAVARKGQHFADGSVPRFNKLTSQERSQALAVYGKPGTPKPQPKGAPRERNEDAGVPMGTPWARSHGLSLSHDHGHSHEHTNESCTAAPLEEPAPPPVKPVRQRVPADADQRWDEFQAIYPARDGDLCKSKGRDKFRELLRKGEDPQAILAGVRRYRQWADATDNTGSRFVKQIPTWLNNRCWEEAYTLPSRASPERSPRLSPVRETPAEAHARVMRELGIPIDDCGQPIGNCN